MKTASVASATALALLALSAPAKADTVVPIEIPTNDQLVTLQGQFIFPINSLNNIPLNGQKLSLDLIFVGSVPLDLRINENEEALGILGPLGISLLFNTNAPSFPGVPSGSSSFLDVSGHKFAKESLGASQASNGQFGVTFNTFDASATGRLPGSSELETSGIELSLTMPNTGFETTGAELVLNVNGDDTAEFGTQAQLPEPSSLASLLLALPLLALWRRLRKSLA